MIFRSVKVCIDLTCEFFKDWVCVSNARYLIIDMYGCLYHFTRLQNTIWLASRRCTSFKCVYNPRAISHCPDVAILKPTPAIFSPLMGAEISHAPFLSGLMHLDRSSLSLIETLNLLWIAMPAQHVDSNYHWNQFYRDTQHSFGWCKSAGCHVHIIHVGCLCLTAGRDVYLLVIGSQAKYISSNHLQRGTKHAY